MGFRSEYMDPYVIEQLAIIAFDRDDRITTEGKNLQVLLFFGYVFCTAAINVNKSITLYKA
jgi:hypothetical protein